MLKYGLEYDHSFSHHDCQCYWLRTGDKWVPIDYSKHPDHWMKPLEPGVTTGLCEIPASWYADDLPPMMFIKKCKIFLIDFFLIEFYFFGGMFRQAGLTIL